MQKLSWKCVTMKEWIAGELESKRASFQSKSEWTNEETNKRSSFSRFCLIHLFHSLQQEVMAFRFRFNDSLLTANSGRMDGWKDESAPLLEYFEWIERKEEGTNSNRIMTNRQCFEFAPLSTTSESPFGDAGDQ